jgi:hypothetical protein
MTKNHQYGQHGPQHPVAQLDQMRDEGFLRCAHAFSTDCSYSRRIDPDCSASCGVTARHDYRRRPSQRRSSLRGKLTRPPETDASGATDSERLDLAHRLSKIGLDARNLHAHRVLELARLLLDVLLDLLEILELHLALMSDLTSET